MIESAAALEALRGRSSRARMDLIHEVMVCLHRIGKEGVRVGFLWVPGHAAVEGNEEADRLARGALREGTVGVDILQGKPEFYSCIREGLEREWQDEWSGEVRGRLYKSVQP